MTTDFENSLEYARRLDQADPLCHFRKQFIFPQHEGKDTLYFCGNSLGLQPVAVRQALIAELDQWAEFGVEGHFRGDKPWMYYHKFLAESSARLVGASPEEVVVMNTLTTNLHLMMVSFYRPSKTRYKILMEAGAFPSDQYAMETQAIWHGFNPDDAVIEIEPRPGEDCLRTEDIIQVIHQHGEQVAIVMFSGVNYYTGQFFDIPAITRAAHAVGAFAGFDLAHTAGNLPLQLHDWQVDFAVWCSYKYLNSGPGGPSGVFVHQKHGNAPEIPRFGGWWGHDESERFLMKKGFKPMPGAPGWQLSNAQIFSCAAHLASLKIFDQAGMEALRKKSMQLTAFLEFILTSAGSHGHEFQIITPAEPSARGCQLSILTGSSGKDLFEYLNQNGVIADWREPNVIRLAPVPLYNSFEDVWQLGKLIEAYNNRH
ncbi:MAG: kynureninase [Saprospiraceae bacterium]|nr:kynureninase [Saprospiraceae bacterium]